MIRDRELIQFVADGCGSIIKLLEHVQTGTRFLGMHTVFNITTIVVSSLRRLENELNNLKDTVDPDSPLLDVSDSPGEPGIPLLNPPAQVAWSLMGVSSRLPLVWSQDLEPHLLVPWLRIFPRFLASPVWRLGLNWALSMRRLGLWVLLSLELLVRRPDLRFLKLAVLGKEP